MRLKSDDLQRVIEFRQRLVTYMSRILEGGSGPYRRGINEDTRRELTNEQPWLAQEYGRLFNVINAWGTTGMGSQAFGLSTRGRAERDSRHWQRLLRGHRPHRTAAPRHGDRAATGGARFFETHT